MWRDRTNLYLAYRSSYAHHPIPYRRYGRSSATVDHFNGLSASSTDAFHDDSRRRLLTRGAYHDAAAEDFDDNDAVIEMDRLPPRWADITDQVTEYLADVDRKSHTLDQLHQKHVLPGFDDDDAAKRAEENEIEALTRQITRAFHDCHRCIQQIEQIVRESKRDSRLSRAEETMARNIKISLATRVQEASSKFRRKQSAYLKKLREMSGGGAAYTNPLERSSTSSTIPGAGLSSSALTSTTSAFLLESDADRSFSQSTLQAPSHRQLLQSNDAAIVQREREIEDISQGIVELSDLFHDLQTIVIDQGTMLDRIDYNVERMATDVKAADKELTVASGYQQRTARRKIIFLLLLIIVGMIILLVVKPKKRHDA